ncbi:hypothetical protein D3C84_1224020 [compost metagenome]
MILNLEVAHDFRHAKHAHGDNHKIDAVHHGIVAEGKAQGTGIEVGADGPDQQAQHQHGACLEQ